ncbi:MAG: hypothetical protein H7A25_02485 [Leptospiraceae bacterium]|nr:hypothetical protein [Leptospiraceae bacterium]
MNAKVSLFINDIGGKLQNSIMRKILNIIFILVLLVNLSVSFAQKKIGNVNSQTPTETEQKELEEDNKKRKETFQRAQHPCENVENGRKASATVKGGLLQYNIDCAPFHAQEILDLTGKSEHSVIGWVILSIE